MIFELERFLKQLERGLEDIQYERFHTKNEEEEKNILIGELPMVLLSKKYFPDNKTLIEFAATSLGLPISYARKRSRREIIGIIITEIAKVKTERIQEFRRALEIVLKKKIMGKTEFFDEWEKAIRSIRLG
jgi:hypothetical protein